MQRMIEAGRWDVVGGTWIQPDTNLPATETFLRHFTAGPGVLREPFGVRPRVAWAADSFGHSAGLPEILAAAGMEGFSFSRPAQNLVPLAKAAFWWEGAWRARILPTVCRPAAGMVASATNDPPAGWLPGFGAPVGSAQRGRVHGLGNHGGGPTRRQILDVYAWAKAHPEVEVRFSTLHRLLDAVRAEARGHGESFLPVHRGELNFCLRGCYASQLGFKTLYRKAEALVNRAERVDALVAARLGRKPADLQSAWEAVLFNSFHDILPGSSIERAYDDQREWLGGALHAARGVEHTALNALTAHWTPAWCCPKGICRDRPCLPCSIRTRTRIRGRSSWRPRWIIARSGPTRTVPTNCRWKCADLTEAAGAIK
jgi:alpha-mannosidase